MTFRNDGDAQKHRIDALEDELEDARAESERLREERDAALAGPKTQFEAGSHVWVEWNGKWWRGTVLRAVTSTLWEIHYDGWSNKWDEAVGLERIAAGDRPAPGRVASTSPSATVGLIAVGLILAAVVAYWFLDGVM